MDGKNFVVDALPFEDDEQPFEDDEEPKQETKQKSEAQVRKNEAITAMNEFASLVPPEEYSKFNQVKLESVSTPSAALSEQPMVLVDYKNKDYRGFSFLVHEQYGLVLLHCTRKKKKGPHFQLPGGHIDEHEFLSAAHSSNNVDVQLLHAARAGAARELYEETGIDIRYRLDRLEPAAIRPGGTVDINGKPLWMCQLKSRFYFFLSVEDGDFMESEDVSSSRGLCGAMGENGSHLMIRLSDEHSGFKFEKDPCVAAELLQHHSGGAGSKALLMSMERDKNHS